MEQRRLGLITKAMMAVPGHCLAQASREFLQLYPNAKILVADETNFVKEKRQRFLARAATGIWDCIIITHSRLQVHPRPGRVRGGTDRRRSSRATPTCWRRRTATTASPASGSSA